MWLLSPAPKLTRTTFCSNINMAACNVKVNQATRVMAASPGSIIVVNGVNFNVICSLADSGKRLKDNWVHLKEAKMHVASFNQQSQGSEKSTQFVYYAISGENNVKQIDVTHDAIRIECNRTPNTAVSRYFFQEVGTGHIKAGTGDLFKQPERGNFCVAMVLCLDGENRYNILLMQNKEGTSNPWYLGSPDAVRDDKKIKICSIDGSGMVMVRRGSEGQNTFEIYS